MDNPMTEKIIITAALAGAATFKNNNPAVPYTPEEFAREAAAAYRAGAAMIHVHARTDDGWATHDIDRIRQTYDAIRQKTPELIVNLSSAVGMGASADQRIAQIVAIKPEMASLNTNTMNFSFVDRDSGRIVVDYIFENTFTMLQDFGRAMEENGVKPEIEIYDIGGFDNFSLIARQGFFTEPLNFNFVWGVTGGQKFRPDAFVALVHAVRGLVGRANFTTCGVGRDEFPAIMQSAIMGGHMRVGLEDNTRLANGQLARGNGELVEQAVKIAGILGKEPATPDEARAIMGLKGRH
jgi:3-keto-5-aminohexanoate cleavage enzyme